MTRGITCQSTRTHNCHAFDAQLCAGHLDVETRMAMLPALKRKIIDAGLFLADALGVVASLSGASVVALTGKLMLAVVLAAISLGFFLRIVGRRRVASSAPPAAPRWWYAASSLAAVAEVAVLVEATDFPVRFSQPGFELYHWPIVIVALAGAFVLNLQVVRALGSSSRVSTSS